MENNIPKKNIKSSKIIKKSADEMTEFDLLDIRLDRMFLGPNGDAMVLLVAEGKQVAYTLNSIESTILIYVQNNCNESSHIDNIYNIYNNTMKGLGNKLEAGIIESKVGDVLYGRIKWVNSKGEPFYLKCSVGDALILATMNKSKIYIIRKVLDDMENVDIQFPNDQSYV